MSCKQALPISDHVFCFNCILDVPFTDHHELLRNELYLKFLGRVEITTASALFYFSKSGIIQKSIHELKYKSNQQIGFEYGKLFGKSILESEYELLPEVLIPVPIHYRKRVRRGYNQAQVFAKGISEITGIPINQKTLTKEDDSDSQTKMSRDSRFENVLNSFTLNNPEALESKHVMIVDDVCTTGATLEACATILSEIKGIKISFGIIAMAQ